MNEAVPFAKRMLEEYGEFFPYGAYIKSGGEIVQVGAYDKDTDQPESKDLLYLLRDSFTSMAKVGECIATAMVIDVKVNLPNTNSRTDAIQVCLEHRDGYSAEVFFPYVIADDGQIVYGPIFAQRGKRELFGTS